MSIIQNFFSTLGLAKPQEPAPQSENPGEAALFSEFLDKSSSSASEGAVVEEKENISPSKSVKQQMKSEISSLEFPDVFPRRRK